METCIMKHKPVITGLLSKPGISPIKKQKIFMISIIFALDHLNRNVRPHEVGRYIKSFSVILYLQKLTIESGFWLCFKNSYFEPSYFFRGVRK